MLHKSAHQLCETGTDLLCRLQQLQSRFTWDLKKEDLELDDLNRQLNHDIKENLGEPGTVVHYQRFLAYVRYLQDQPDEADSLLSQSEQMTRECYGEESELRLIVTYGDLAWLKYHRGLYSQSQSYCQRVHNILVKYLVASSTDLHPEVYGEKAGIYLKLSKSYYNKAIDCFCKALEQQPDKFEWSKGYAIVLYRTEKYVTDTNDEESPATKQLRQALKINPDDPILLSLLALKLMNYQKHKEAESLVERALEIGHGASKMFEEVLEKVEEEPDNIRQFIYRCYAEFCHYYINQREKLKKIAEQRLDKNCRDSVAYGILGAVAKAEDEVSGAVRYYERALDNDMNNDEYLSSLCELRLQLE